jgi:5,5'-dehydrodivanillate O-demethylase
MISPELNRKLTQVGPGTPGGNLLRYYWHPVAPAADLDENPVKRVRLLGENLVLYRDRSGTLGLIADRCPHRRTSLEHGVPEDEGLRCAYHGWRFNEQGRCLEQPGEPWDSTFKDRVQIAAYPVQELGGLIFAYLGPQPVPLLPRYDLLVWDNVVRHVGITALPCNWLQCMENSLDPIHVEWLHGRFMDYVGQRRGEPPRKPMARHERIGFDVFEHGIIKRRILEGQSEHDEGWQVGHPVVFPTILKSVSALHFRVPVDDENTQHILYKVYRTGLPAPHQEHVPVYEIPLKDEYDRFVTATLIVQDFMVWVSQGAIAERDQEQLGHSDVGVIMFRQMLQEQIERVERGLEPSIEIYRDPAANQCILLAEESQQTATFNAMPESRWIQQPSAYELHDPLRAFVVRYLEEAEALVRAGKLTLPPREGPIPPIGGERHRQVVLLPT